MTDSWETIVNAVKNNNTDMCNLCDEKEIDMGDLGTHTVRIANKTTLDECNTDVFSQTACGFAIEFKDVVTEYNLTLTNTSTEGWPSSDMRKYINTIIYDALPENIKSKIIDMIVVSGRDTKSKANFTTTDKLYLLDILEVYVVNEYIFHTAKSNERQLNYYAGKCTSVEKCSSAIKNIME